MAKYFSAVAKMKGLPNENESIVFGPEMAGPGDGDGDGDGESERQKRPIGRHVEVVDCKGKKHTW